MFTHRSLTAAQLFHIGQPLHKSDVTQLLHAPAFTRRSFDAESSFLHKESFKQNSLHSEIHVHTVAFSRSSFCNTRQLYTKAFSYKSQFQNNGFDTEQPFHRAAFTIRSVTDESLYPQTFLHREALTLYLYTKTSFAHNMAFIASISQFYCSFDVEPSFRANTLRRMFQDQKFVSLF